MPTIAWIGLGLMGNPMSKHMIKAGYTVRGVDIDATARESAAANGVLVADTIAAACKDADVVYSMLPSGADVHEVMTLANGVFASARPGTIVIDCSTIGIDYARKLHAAAEKAGVVFVEAPVSGGTEGARDGTLTFMIGCDKKYAGQATELLQPLGDYIAYVGGPGAGQAAKVVNNLIMAVSVTVNCEATALGQRLGLDMKAFFEIATRSSADNWSFRLWNPAPGVVEASPASNGYKPGFKTWLLAKDLSLAVEAGREVGARLETAETAYALMTRHAEAGGADLDATSLVLHLSRNT
ncbi:3-hydroxyisobutyrate dehydrogenase [Cupriavidus consociatus]|uniref:3-hydroxyisobutyrate dehydrogenase n=1 Tax=Cupriavidus consociatus TaxID=2821357 RepID=UPI001AE5AA9E|nr:MULTISPECIES: 3-hydroxyisobutyrate dehydrogenase [unclassified Cupriavidus]MBP0620923.1 3-hydroxyisobutyrate dehydrogenase [Cupriavidus sp. LEh25]MDK2657589.1 3-hydroxyisobutyrate dehydrogenase [Cupriavidus sp. LEh21]